MQNFVVIFNNANFTLVTWILQPYRNTSLRPKTMPTRISYLWLVNSHQVSIKQQPNPHRISVLTMLSYCWFSGVWKWMCKNFKGLWYLGMWATDRVWESYRRGWGKGYARCNHCTVARTGGIRIGIGAGIDESSGYRGGQGVICADCWICRCHSKLTQELYRFITIDICKPRSVYVSKNTKSTKHI